VSYGISVTRMLGFQGPPSFFIRLFIGSEVFSLFYAADIGHTFPIPCPYGTPIPLHGQLPLFRGN